MNCSQLHNTSNNDSVTDTTRRTALMVVESCILSFLDFAALLGNLLVCKAIHRNPSLRTVTNYFVLSLALTDLSMAVLVMPLSVTSSIANTWVAGDFGCKIHWFCGNCLVAISLFTVMLLAINRYLHVTNPALCRNTFSEKRSIAMAASAWILSIVVVIVVFFISGIKFGTVPFQPSFCLWVYSDTSRYVLVTVVRNIFIVVPSLVIVVCYLKIYLTMRQHNTAVAPSSQGGHSALGVEEAKMTRILTVVVFGFNLCWLPVFISNILTVIGVVTEIKYLNFYLTFPIFTSSVINPIIYAAMSHAFRNEFMKILQCGY